jgi:hypothetical protein
LTYEIALVLIILGVSLVLFVTEWVRMDVVALLVLGATALTGSSKVENRARGVL